MTLTIFFRWVAWLLVLAIAIFTVAPIGFRPITGTPVSFERFAAFAVVGSAFCLGYPRHRLHVLVLLIGIVGLLEVVQNFVPSRHGRAADGLVKASGALIGAAFTMFLRRTERASKPDI